MEKSTLISFPSFDGDYCFNAVVMTETMAQWIGGLVKGISLPFLSEQNKGIADFNTLASRF